MPVCSCCNNHSSVANALLVGAVHSNACTIYMYTAYATYYAISAQLAWPKLIANDLVLCSCSNGKS